MVDTSNRQLAVVTGASSGIGLELARQFVEHEFDVVAVAENEELEQVSGKLAGAAGAVIPVLADLADFEGVEQVCERLRQLGRPVEALALNAGIGVGGPFVETALEDDLRLIALNVTSTVHLAKRVLPDMVASGRGRVLVTASVASTMPGPYYATYAASKAFVLSFAEAVRHELLDTGVTVTALMPGPTDTDFFSRADMEDTKAATSDKDDPADVAREGFEGMLAGTEHVVAGSLSNKLQVFGQRLMPERVQAALHAKFVEPGSGTDDGE